MNKVNNCLDNRPQSTVPGQVINKSRLLCPVASQLWLLW